MSRIEIARGFKLAATPTGRQRALAASLGSGVSNLVTGTLASPFLFASDKRRFSSKKFKKDPRKHLREIYGREALGKGLALAGVSMIGGGLREGVQARVESRLSKFAASDGLASMATGHSGDLLRVSGPVSAPTGSGDAVRTLEDMRADEMVRRRTTRKDRPIQSDLQVGKTAMDGEDTAQEELGPPPNPAERQRALRRSGTALERFARSRQGSKTADLRSIAERESRSESFSPRRTAVGVGAGAVAGGLIAAASRRSVAAGSLLGASVAGGAYAADEVSRRSRKSFARKTLRKQASQFGIMVYQRDPRELPESKRPPMPKGRLARMFGTRMHGGHALHRRAQKDEDEWMSENGEFVEIGNRPGIRRALRDVAGLEKDQILSRSEVSKMVAERRHAKSTALGRRKGMAKAKEHVHPHSPEDVVEVYRTLEQLLDNPASKFFQVT